MKAPTILRSVMGAALTGLLCASASGGAHGAAAQSLLNGRQAVVKLELHGKIYEPDGKPAAHAFVGLGPAIVESDSQGNYKVTIPRAAQVPGFMWAPGAVFENFTFDLSWIPVGTLSSGLPPFDLTTAFDNPSDGAVLRGLAAVLSDGRQFVHIHGRSQTPLEGETYVTKPDGWVSRYHLNVSGSDFSGTVPFDQKGEYQVELLATSGLQVFDIPVFHGVAPTLPLGPKFPADPASGRQVTLATFALGLVNSVRSHMGLRSLRMNRKARRAALAHTQDMARYGYYFQHPHIGSDGSTPRSRLLSVGVRFNYVGEAIGAGQTIGQAMDALFMSPAHRMILTGNYRMAGVGLARWDGMWIMTIDVCR